MSEAAAAPAYPYVSSVGRDFFFPAIALVAAVLLPLEWILWSFVVVGHAHFLMAYLYQYRGKKMDARYLITAAVLALGTLAYFFSGGGALGIMLAAGILFSIHFAIDEFTLHSEQFSSHTWFSIAAFASLFSGLVLVLVPPTFGFGQFLPLLFGLALAALCARLAFGGMKLSRAEFYLGIVASILAILALGFHMPEKVIGVVLLLHFANWYAGYGARLKAKPERARQYWIEVAVTLAIAFVIFVPFRFLNAFFLAFLFAPAYYYGWAIAHIVLSFVSALPRRAG